MTADGYLAVRSWRRTLHAECRFLRIDGDSLRLELDLYGLDSECADLVAIRRTHPMELAFPVRVSRDDGHGVVEIALAELARCRLSRHDDWDLWVETRDGSRGRVGRLFDDVPDRKSVYTQPLLTFLPPDELPWVEVSPASALRLRPYFTVDSDLSIYVAE